MEQGKRYLVKKKDVDFIREWQCLETSETAYKVQDNVQYKGGVFYSISNVTTSEAFWILKTDVDKIGQSKYHILEELKTA